MMVLRQCWQGALLFQFCHEGHLPAGHLLRSDDRFIDLAGLRCELAPLHSETGRPSAIRNE